MRHLITHHIIAFAVISFFIVLPAFGGIYRCIDENGKTIISNAPCHYSGSKEVFSQQSHKNKWEQTDEEVTSPAAVKIAASTSPEARPRRGGQDPLKVVQETNYRRGDYLYIQGVVRNRSRETLLRYVKIKVKLYDRAGQFLGIEDTYTDPTHLAPGQEGTYTIMVRGQPKLYRYETSALWNEQPYRSE